MSTEATPSVPPLAEKPDFLKQRLLSLDVYRGLIMVALAFEGFGLAATAKKHLEAGYDPDVWEPIRYQFDHAQWVGCSFWDLIQPSFMFMVGVAAAYSFAKRQETGHSWFRLFLHVCWRSLILVFLGIFLISNNQPSTTWSFMNVLTQIGLGYPFLYVLWHFSFPFKSIAVALLLIGTYLAYALYPHAGIDLERGAPEVGVTKAWAQEFLKDLRPAWHKNANVGQAIDVQLLNHLPLTAPTGPRQNVTGAFLMQNNPMCAAACASYYLSDRETSFVFNNGGYQTINFVPSLATMLIGLICGELLRSPRSAGGKFRLLVVVGIAGLIAGQALNLTGVCPLVKRIWTPSWALFSTGWCCLILAALYGVIDIWGFKRWAFPLVVVGVNSIAIYCMGMLLKRWTANMLRTHLGQDLFQPEGWELWEPVIRSCAIGIVFWLMCWWMYRQKIFIRI